MRLSARFLAPALIVLTASCDQGYDPPEEADPFESIAPAPGDTAAVPGAGEPGTQPPP